jgi:DNA-binding transcriptional MocR family regulator
MDWTSLDLSPRSLRYVAVADAIQAAISEGVLTSGTRLPTHRALAEILDLSVPTVSASYKELQRRGVIYSVVGRGSFVRTQNQSANFMLTGRSPDAIDFSFMEASYSPEQEPAIREVLQEIAEHGFSSWANESRPVAGLERHREAALPFLESLGVPATTDRVVITNGATQGLFLALSALTRPGDVVLTESLTEPGIIGAAAMLGVTLRGLPTDSDGIIPEAFDAACRQTKVAALVWVPTLGNPTNHVAGRARREDVARVAQRNNVAVIEDEVYKPLLEERLPSIAELLPDLGFFVTSLTKSALTGLRTGYLVVPGTYSLRLAGLLRSNTWSASSLLAEIASRWLENGTMDKLISAQRIEARNRHVLLHDRLGPHIRGSHQASPRAWLALPQGWSEASISSVLRDRNILVATSAAFVVNRSQAMEGIRVCLTGRLSEDVTKAALDVVRECLEQRPTYMAAELV